MPSGGFSDRTHCHSRDSFRYRQVMIDFLMRVFRVSWLITVHGKFLSPHANCRSSSSSCRESVNFWGVTTRWTPTQVDHYFVNSFVDESADLIASGCLCGCRVPFMSSRLIKIGFKRYLMFAHRCLMVPSRDWDMFPRVSNQCNPCPFCVLA